MNSVVVFCGSSKGKDPQILLDAEQLGAILAKRGMTLVYGAARIGVMGRVADACLKNGGTVVGVIPDFLMKREVYHDGLSQLIITESMHERKLQMHERSDGIIMLPGGYGTLEEFFEMLTWAQLGLHHKPIGILNTNGFYDQLLTMIKNLVDQDFVKEERYDMILVDADSQQLLDKMKKYSPLPAPK